MSKRKTATSEQPKAPPTDFRSVARVLDDRITRATFKLDALRYLFAECDPDMGIDTSVMTGLGYIVDDISNDLNGLLSNEEPGEGGAR